MVTGKEVHTKKSIFYGFFEKKVVLDVSRWAWHMRKRVIYRKKPIFLKLALIPKDTAVNSHHPSNNFQSGEEELLEQNLLFRRFWHSTVSDGLFRQEVFPP